MIGVIHSIDEMPDLDEMIEAKNADTREDQIDGIVERIFEDWDCPCSSSTRYGRTSRTQVDTFKGEDGQYVPLPSKGQTG